VQQATIRSQKPLPAPRQKSPAKQNTFAAATLRWSLEHSETCQAFVMPVGALLSDSTAQQSSYNSDPNFDSNSERPSWIEPGGAASGNQAGDQRNSDQDQQC